MPFHFFYGRQQLPDNKMANDDRLANNGRVLIILNASMKRHTIKRTFISCKLHGGASFTAVADRMTSVVKNAGAMSAMALFGLAAMSDVSPQCAPNRTLTSRCQLTSIHEYASSERFHPRSPKYTGSLRPTLRTIGSV